MTIIGQLRITDSFKIHGRGLVAIGELMEGRIKVGCYVTFHTGVREVTMKIGGVSGIRADPPRQYHIGVTFVYGSDEERTESEKLKLVEQLVDIEDRDDAMNQGNRL